MIYPFISICFLSLLKYYHQGAVIIGVIVLCDEDSRFDPQSGHSKAIKLICSSLCRKQKRLKLSQRNSTLFTSGSFFNKYNFSFIHKINAYLINYFLLNLYSIDAIKYILYLHVNNEDKTLNILETD